MPRSFEEIDTMIISHKYKFIFIKTSKTAGTSIEIYLSSLCGRNDILTPIYPPVEQHVARNYAGIFNPLRETMINLGAYKWKEAIRTCKELIQRRKFYNHIPAYKVKCRVGSKIWNSYYKFCVERNPWDKTLSHYHMVNCRGKGKLTLNQYIKRGGFCLNHFNYTDRLDPQKIIVNKVVKYENLLVDLDKIFKKLGVPFEGTLNVNAKSDYRKDRRPYQEIFTQNQKDIISKIFKPEIDLHGYTF